MNLSAAMEIFWKLKSLTLTISLRKEEMDDDGNIETSSGDFLFQTEPGIQCVTNMEPKERVCAKYYQSFCLTKAYMNGVSDGAPPVEIFGPFHKENGNYENGDFYFSIYVAAQLAGFGLMSGREAPSSTNFLGTEQLEILGHPFTLYAASESYRGSYLYSASLHCQTYQIGAEK